MKTIDKLKKYPKSRQQTQKFQEDLNSIKSTLQNGFDIRCTDSDRIRTSQKHFKVNMAQPEEDLWKDNCVPTGDAPCVRNMWCGGDDKDWCKAALKRQERSIRKRNVDENTLETLPLSDSDEDDDGVESKKRKFMSLL